MDLLVIFAVGAAILIVLILGLYYVPYTFKQRISVWDNWFSVFSSPHPDWNSCAVCKKPVENTHSSTYCPNCKCVFHTAHLMETTGLELCCPCCEYDFLDKESE